VKQVVLKHALTAQPAASDFDLVETTQPPCPQNGVLARVIDVSLDPYVGSRIRGRHMGEPAPRPGLDPIPGAAIIQIAESKTPSFRPGDHAHTMDAGWAEYVALDAKQVRKIDPSVAPLPAFLSVLGMPGLTAWAGITKLARVQADDVVLIDAAAGAVGGTAGQLAKARGARVVGIAGGPEKCRLVRDVYGFDACVDYRAERWTQALNAALDRPPTVHFENVSTGMLEIAMGRLALYGRVILCGLAGQYHSGGGPASIPAGMVIGKRAQLMGLVVYDFYDRWEAFIAETAPLVRSGAITFAEDRVAGLENAAALFQRLMQGENIGKCVVGVALS
jgi:NADPH-dependent curcumin reductase CurA